MRYWTGHRREGEVFSQVLEGEMRTEREAREKPRPLSVDTLWVDEMRVRVVDTTGDTVPDSHLLTVETGEVRMESV